MVRVQMPTVAWTLRTFATNAPAVPTRCAAPWDPSAEVKTASGIVQRLTCHPLRQPGPRRPFRRRRPRRRRAPAITSGAGLVDTATGPTVACRALRAGTAASERRASSLQCAARFRRTAIAPMTAHGPAPGGTQIRHHRHPRRRRHRHRCRHCLLHSRRRPLRRGMPSMRGAGIWHAVSQSSVHRRAMIVESSATLRACAALVAAMRSAGRCLSGKMGASTARTVTSGRAQRCHRQPHPWHRHCRL